MSVRNLLPRLEWLDRMGRLALSRACRRVIQGGEPASLSSFEWPGAMSQVAAATASQRRQP